MLIILLLRLIVLSIIGYVIWSMWKNLSPHYSVRITVTSTGIEEVHGISLTRATDAVAFLQELVAPHHKMVIQAGRQRDGNLKIKLNGNLDPGSMQRLRNVLCTII